LPVHQDEQIHCGKGIKTIFLELRMQTRTNEPEINGKDIIESVTDPIVCMYVCWLQHPGVVRLERVSVSSLL
jgi:hypothetical protein